MDFEFITKEKDACGRPYKIIFGEIETIQTVCGSEELCLIVNGVEVEGSYNNLKKILFGKFDMAFQKEHFGEDGFWRL